jgi:hypothetical protein
LVVGSNAIRTACHRHPHRPAATSPKCVDKTNIDPAIDAFEEAGGDCSPIHAGTHAIAEPPNLKETSHAQPETFGILECILQPLLADDFVAKARAELTKQQALASLKLLSRHSRITASALQTMRRKAH